MARCRLTATVWREGDQCVSRCPELGVASCGDTPDQALDALREAVELYLEYLRGYRSCSPLSISTYAVDLRCFWEFLTARGSLPAPDEITRQTAVQYAVGLSGLSPVTVRRRLSCLSSFFSFLQDMGYVPGNPARRLPLPKLEQHVPVAVAEEQAQQLIAAAQEPWHRCLVVLLLATGLRRSEVVQVSLEDVDLQARQFLVYGKGGKQRIVPLTKSAMEAIQQYLPHRPVAEHRHLFVNGRGEPLRGQFINRTLQELLARAGLSGQGITPHKLGHTFATQLIQQAVDVRAVQELLGYADLETAAGYLYSDVRAQLEAGVVMLTLLWRHLVLCRGIAVRWWRRLVPQALCGAV